MVIAIVIPIFRMLATVLRILMVIVIVMVMVVIVILRAVGSGFERRGLR